MIAAIFESFLPRKNNSEGIRTMTKRNRRPITKFSTADTNSFIHPNISYRLSDERRELIDRVNHYYRLGLKFQDIAEAVDTSVRTVYRLYFGFADYCLSPKQLEELQQIPNSMQYWMRTLTRIAEPGEIPTRRNVLQPIYTNVSIREIPYEELTDSQPMPFEVITTKYIPTYPDRKFGKRDNNQESWEKVDIVEITINCKSLKPYAVIYCGACCTI